MVAANSNPPLAPASGLVLIVGGSRSGKSRWAETLAKASGRSVLYLATAADRPGDLDWQRRLALHQQRRPGDWSCVETGPDLCSALSELRTSKQADSAPVVLIDSLGTWLAQHLDVGDQQWQARQDELLSALQQLSAPVLLVAEEVGMGVVPSTAIGCRFRDRMGTCLQALMQQATASWLVVAGRAVDLHAIGLRVPA